MIIFMSSNQLKLDFRKTTLETLHELHWITDHAWEIHCSVTIRARKNMNDGAKSIYWSPLSLWKQNKSRGIHRFFTACQFLSQPRTKFSISTLQRNLKVAKPSETVRWQTTALNPSTGRPWASGTEIKHAAYTVFSKIDDLWSTLAPNYQPAPSGRKWKLLTTQSS